MLAPELVVFLRRCQCEVDHLGPATLGVGLKHAIDLETAAQQLKLHGATSGVTAPVRDQWARMEVEAYLKVWRALNPECSVELVA
jgi:hypothetical protein